MRILLTGATGFVGGHVLNALLADGHDVVCAVRRKMDSSNPRLSYLTADFAKDSDKSVWLARLAGIDVVINTVGIFRESKGQSFFALHTETPRALFAACAEAGTVRMVLQLSALGADEHATSAYHLSKKAADDYLAGLPVPSWIVQPSLVYGKGGASARVFRMLASMPLMVRFGDAPQLVQPIHIDDVTAAFVALVRTAPVTLDGALRWSGPKRCRLPIILVRCASRWAWAGSMCCTCRAGWHTPSLPLANGCRAPCSTGTHCPCSTVETPRTPP